ncbi:MAG TPA: fumarylacetoacetate hydrolase family protein [Ktedonobacteraceae bacterium]|nr:fumarylacetoacetate hydrolase family protein [Ktedonobacteraceae bacterium]
MRLVTYSHEGQARTGAQIDGQIIDLNRAYAALLRHQGNDDELAVASARVPTDMIALLQGGETSLKAAQDALSYVRGKLAASDGQHTLDGIVYASEQIAFLAPVLRPGKVLCLGLNYRDHAAEAEMLVPDYPILFHKVAGSLTGHKQPIIIPRTSSRIDYEGELAVIVGRRGKYIAEQDALAYVVGYCAANDVSARDLQFRTSQWTTGKMLDTFGPLGPALVTKDEVPDPHALSIKTILNGQVMQNASTADMIFRVPFIISYISGIVTLEAGDVIMTGTPSGIGNTRKPQVFMKPGDTVTVEIERLGSLTNPLVAEE